VVPPEQLLTSDDFESAGIMPHQQQQAAVAAPAAVLSEVELHDWEGAGDDVSALLRGHRARG
jgi:hypothetical protein